MVPDDFVRFVARHGPRLARACAEIAGHDQMAEALRDALLVDVAGRWRRWPDAARTQRALVRLERLLRREARSQRAVVDPAALDLRSSLHLRPATERTESDDPARHLAARVWPRATTARRVRWVALAAAALVALAAVVLTPDRPPPLPTEVPEDVVILPAFDDLARVEDQGLLTFPSHLFLDRAAVDQLPVLSTAPLQFAVVVAAASGERLVVAGFDHRIDQREFVPPSRPLQRRVAHPALRGARLLSTSLAPDGTMVALPNGSDLILVDVRTGAVRGLDVRAHQPEPPVVTWLDSRRVLLPGANGSLVVDTTSDEVHSVSIDPGDILTLQGSRNRPLARLVALPEAPEGSASSRAVLEYWREMDGTGTVEPVAGAGQVSLRRIVTGPPWLGAWAGPGWASTQLIARACDPATLVLPPEVGSATAAIAAVDPDGTHVATLVATDGARIEPLGYRSPRETLIGVRTTGRSLVAVWEPSTGRLAMVILIGTDTSVSVADVLLPLGPRP